MQDNPAPDRRAWLSPPFLACATLLVTAALGLHPVLGVVIDRFSKQPIGLRKPLDDFDAGRVTSFRRVSGGGVFAKTFQSFQDSAGTDDILRVLFEERDAAPDHAASDDVSMVVTYYSDPRDSVPHTPEVCYRQGGAIVRSMKSVPVEIPGLAEGPDAIEARLIEFTPILFIDGEAIPAEHQDNGWRQAVLYTFVCNGEFYHDREQVRWAIGKPGGRYTYFAKVEVESTCAPGSDFQATVTRCRRALGEALAVLVDDHFPTTEQINGTAPPPPRGEDAGASVMDHS